MSDKEKIIDLFRSLGLPIYEESDSLSNTLRLLNGAAYISFDKENDNEIKEYHGGYE